MKMKTASNLGSSNDDGSYWSSLENDDSNSNMDVEEEIDCWIDEDIKKLQLPLPN